MVYAGLDQIFFPVLLRDFRKKVSHLIDFPVEFTDIPVEGLCPKRELAHVLRPGLINHDDLVLFFAFYCKTRRQEPSVISSLIGLVLFALKHVFHVALNVAVGFAHLVLEGTQIPVHSKVIDPGSFIASGRRDRRHNNLFQSRGTVPAAKPEPDFDMKNITFRRELFGWVKESLI